MNKVSKTPSVKFHSCPQWGQNVQKVLSDFSVSWKKSQKTRNFRKPIKVDFTQEREQNVTKSSLSSGVLTSYT
jgi:hypothetical protein